mmetsp:Transcript_22044/g.46581  ORF Transcript_22044/g.46581 Transcript_22044/m.46581 type:complete len:258 (-) Transcript_22044:327-1100(-)
MQVGLLLRACERDPADHLEKPENNVAEGEERRCIVLLVDRHAPLFHAPSAPPHQPLAHARVQCAHTHRGLPSFAIGAQGAALAARLDEHVESIEEAPQCRERRAREVARVLENTRDQRRREATDETAMEKHHTNEGQVSLKYVLPEVHVRPLDPVGWMRYAVQEQCARRLRILRRFFAEHSDKIVLGRQFDCRHDRVHKWISLLSKRKQLFDAEMVLGPHIAESKNFNWFVWSGGQVTLQMPESAVLVKELLYRPPV